MNVQMMNPLSLNNHQNVPMSAHVPHSHLTSPFTPPAGHFQQQTFSFNDSNGLPESSMVKTKIKHRRRELPESMRFQEHLIPKTSRQTMTLSERLKIPTKNQYDYKTKFKSGAVGKKSAQAVQRPNLDIINPAKQMTPQRRALGGARQRYASQGQKIAQMLPYR